MKKQLASFRDLLATGNLGPVTPDMTLKDIATALGPPDGWNVDHDHPVPVYWFFGKLEISFDSAAPYQMNWFQIEGATQLRGKSATLTERLRLSLDGFSGETKPSEFLSAGLWDSRQATVYYAALSDDILLNICTGCIQIHFQVDTAFIDDREAIEYLASRRCPSLLEMSILERRSIASTRTRRLPQKRYLEHSTGAR
ncbi:conserved hypothetical protein [Mesorhizobium sp. SOD10]|nr:conserved hypothetical protein [Mesorhizobium sp. SOD10]